MGPWRGAIFPLKIICNVIIAQYKTSYSMAHLGKCDIRLPFIRHLLPKASGSDRGTTGTPSTASQVFAPARVCQLVKQRIWNNKENREIAKIIPISFVYG